jgi:hypothetical protein
MSTLEVCLVLGMVQLEQMSVPTYNFAQVRYLCVVSRVPHTIVTPAVRIYSFIYVCV